MSNNNKSAFIGFETWYNKFRMEIKMQKYIIYFCIFVQLVVLAILYKYHFDASQHSILNAYYRSNIVGGKNKTDVLLGDKTYKVTYDYAKKEFEPYVKTYLTGFMKVAKWTFLVYLLFIPVNIYFIRRARRQTESEFLRGARLVAPEELNKFIKVLGEKTDIKIGEVNMPISAENKHAFIIGRPGVGKTVCISQILSRVIERGNRCIIHDFKGDYLAKFYRPGIDIIFNPLDERSAYWNFFDEIEDRTDKDAVGYALIPDAKGAGMDPFWNNAARDVLVGCLNFMMYNNLKTYKDLHNLLTKPSTDIGNYLLQTEGSEAGATAIADPESKQTGSIMSVMTQYTKIFGYMPDGGKRFTLKEWLNNPNGGNIYITNYAKLQNTLAPILSLMIDLLARQLLSMQDDIDRRIFFILDEFGMLGKMQSTVPILTQGRSKGAGVYIGIQDIGQIDKIYGGDDRKSIINACGTNIVFNVNDESTSNALSNKFGEKITLESNVTQSMGVSDNRDGMSITRQEKKERVILPSELSSLPDLNCYIQFPGTPITKNIIKYKGYPNKHTPFIMRKGLKYDELLAVEKVIQQEKMKEKGIVNHDYVVEEPIQSEGVNAARIDDEENHSF